MEKKTQSEGLDEKKVKYSEAEAEEESQPIMSFPLSSESRCPSEIIDIISHTILTCLLAFFPPKRVSDARNKSFCSVCAPSKKKKTKEKKSSQPLPGVCVCADGNGSFSAPFLATSQFSFNWGRYSRRFCSDSESRCARISSLRVLRVKRLEILFLDKFLHRPPPLEECAPLPRSGRGS